VRESHRCADHDEGSDTEGKPDATPAEHASMVGGSTILPTMTDRSRDEFATPAEWAAWLEVHQEAPDGVWMRIAKKGSGAQTVTHAEALEIALCYGWIDGQRKGLDETHFLQRFTPRRKRSIWSKVNRSKAEALIASGEMRPAGLREVKRAKEDGRWDAAYDSWSTAEIPDDLAAELAAHPDASRFYDTLNRHNRYAILHRIQTAKRPETRARRIAQYVAMLDRGETIHPQ
jgi:uncharacterized protein YdeI (YjbR/CyaY-like superfamily)